MTIPDMEPVSDEDLIARSRLDGLSQSRRDALLDELFGRYHRRIAAWCWRVTGDRESAADLAQDVLLRAHRNLHQFSGRSRFSTWIYSIARNHCLNELQARNIRPEGSSTVLDFDLADNTQDVETELALAGEMARRKAMIREVLNPEELRAMTLHYGAEMPLRTVTSVLKLTNPSGAKALIVNARRKLKQAAAQWRTA